MTIKEILEAAEKLQDDIKAERKRSGKLHMAGALHMSDHWCQYLIGDLERHQRHLGEEE